MHEIFSIYSQKNDDGYRAIFEAHRCAADIVGSIKFIASISPAITIARKSAKKISYIEKMCARAGLAAIRSRGLRHHKITS